MTSNLTVFAKELRKNASDAENQLWYHLKGKKLGGLKFRRQQPIGRYIVDFVCLSRMLVVELDGGQHAEEENEKYDTKRTLWLEGEGYKVLRFWNNEVLENMEGVWDVIEGECRE